MDAAPYVRYVRSSARATEEANPVMRELDGTGSSSAPPIKAPELPDRTHEQEQHDAIAETQRHLNWADYQLTDVEHAHDPRGWEAKHARLQKQIATPV